MVIRLRYVSDVLCELNVRQLGAFFLGVVQKRGAL